MSESEFTISRCEFYTVRCRKNFPIGSRIGNNGKSRCLGHSATTRTDLKSKKCAAKFWHTCQVSTIIFLLLTLWASCNRSMLLWYDHGTNLEMESSEPCSQCLLSQNLFCSQEEYCCVCKKYNVLCLARNHPIPPIPLSSCWVSLRLSYILSISC